MIDFREAQTGAEIIEIKAKLLPPIAQVGQRVWWNGIWGEIYAGRIRRIEIGVAGACGHRWSARKYVAEAQEQSDAQGTGKVYKITHTWESECVGGEIEGERDPLDNRFFKFHLTEDAAVQKAVRQLRDHAEHLRREAAGFDERASLMLLSITEPKAA